MPGAALSSPYLFSSYRDRRSVTEPYRQTGGSFSVLTKHACTYYVRTLSVSFTGQTLIDTTSFSNPLLHLKLLWPDWAKRRVQGMGAFRRVMFFIPLLRLSSLLCSYAKKEYRWMQVNLWLWEDSCVKFIWSRFHWSGMSITSSLLPAGSMERMPT